MLVKSFPHNWCAIAQVMMTKSCRQVYDFSKEELGTAGGVKKNSSQEGRPLPKNKKKNTKTKQRALYKGHSQDGERENNQPYSPCHHPGLPCSEQTCSCLQKGNFCEKFCHCPLDCDHRSVLTLLTSFGCPLRSEISVYDVLTNAGFRAVSVRVSAPPTPAPVSWHAGSVTPTSAPVVWTAASTGTRTATPAGTS